MNQANIKIVFVAAIIGVLWGGYKISRSLYTAFVWEKTEGVVVDFERRVWSCGRWVSQCYDLVVRYEVYGNPYRLVSDRSFEEKAPSHLLNTRLGVYYRPGKPSEALLAGSYGPLGHGLVIFIAGTIVLIIFWYKWKN